MEKERVRKRPRLVWDVAATETVPEAQRALVLGNGVASARHVSPPRRDDDRDGHYVFALGENLTSRYKILSKMGEGLGWTYPCDLWSVGCILVELFSGGALFQTHENLEHLAMMERVLGPLPEHMIRRANQGAEKYFRRGSRLNWPEGAVSRESIRAVKKLDRLKDMLLQHVGSSRSSLIDLLCGLLQYDPSERLTARQALNHPFFRNLT
ncbi:serine/threonine-protein kinase AFC3 [Tripterygium wilfordii]|uniref:Serine/threonine-protein kinase AFC3 n=1 Tax=Tripterygium wilfordii TaxID=458696 RepID=A0A7J7DPG3_TRIWF|nr:serine/threonine-protein kinase AFC3 [Tripterygium wilfordii]